MMIFLFVAGSTNVSIQLEDHFTNIQSGIAFRKELTCRRNTTFAVVSIDRFCTFMDNI